MKRRRQFGREVKRTRHIWTDEMEQELRRLVRAGQTDQEMAAALGVTVSAVLNRRSKLRLVKPIHAGQPKPTPLPRA